MANLNRVLLIGNLTRDPELRYTTGGTAIVKFGLAVNRRYRNKNSQQMEEETCFIDVEGFGSQAETFNQYMSKGRPVFIEGRLRLDSWESKEGQKRNKLLVVMEGFQFLGGGGAGGGGGGGEERAPRKEPRKQGSQVGAGKPSEEGGPPEDYDFDDIPF